MFSLYDECNSLFTYDSQTGLLTRKKNGSVIGANGKGYVTVKIEGVSYPVHRIVWLMAHGSLPKKYIDHINGIKSDNRLCNLREATHSENQCNSPVRCNNSSGLKGAHKTGSRKNPYSSSITKNGQKFFLGYFLTDELAHQAYIEASKKHHGEFSNIETKNRHRKMKIININLSTESFEDLKLVAKAHDRTIKSMAKVAIEAWAARELTLIEKANKSK